MPLINEISDCTMVSVSVLGSLISTMATMIPGHHQGEADDGGEGDDHQLDGAAMRTSPQSTMMARMMTATIKPPTSSASVLLLTSSSECVLAG